MEVQHTSRYGRFIGKRLLASGLAAAVVLGGSFEASVGQAQVSAARPLPAPVIAQQLVDVPEGTVAFIVTEQAIDTAGLTIPGNGPGFLVGMDGSSLVKAQANADAVLLGAHEATALADGREYQVQPMGDASLLNIELRCESAADIFVCERTVFRSGRSARYGAASGRAGSAGAGRVRIRFRRRPAGRAGGFCPGGRPNGRERTGGRWSCNRTGRFDAGDRDRSGIGGAGSDTGRRDRSCSWHNWERYGAGVERNPGILSPAAIQAIRRRPFRSTRTAMGYMTRRKPRTALTRTIRIPIRMV